MTESPRRPTLHLKIERAPPQVPKPAAPAPKPAARPPRSAAPAPSSAARWKCRPCGAAFELPTDAPDDFIVRCPGCHARLGKLMDFAPGPDGVLKVRARPAPPAAKAAR